jgi:hypothetical protein
LGQTFLNIFIAFTVLMTPIASSADSISITAVGDIMLGPQLLPTSSDLFLPAKEWIQSGHIRFGNYEGTFFDGPPQADGKQPGLNRYAFKSPTKMVSILKDAGFNVMSLSNNHIKDYGLAGIKSTKQTLQKSGIQYSSKAGEIATFNIEGTTVSLIATDFYKAPRSITERADTLAEIKELKEIGSLVIVSAHVGREGVGAEYINEGIEMFLGENRGDSKRFAQEAIDKGADVIIMHGPHVPRGMDVYKDRLIIYSLGNFVTGAGISIDGISRIAPLVRVEIDKRGNFLSGQIVPFIQKREPHRIELDKQRNAIVLMRKLTQQQFPNSRLKIHDNGQF